MQRDMPHYLKPLTSTNTPSRLLWLACRGVPTKRHDHIESRFHTAALGATWWTRTNHVRKDRLTTHTSPLELWATASVFCKPGRRVVLFAYDLAEQMRLSALLTHLPELGWELDKIVMEKAAAWCLLRDGRKSLLCCDLKSWCPVEWHKLVSDIGAEPEPGRLALAGEHAPSVWCTWRATVIREATLQILNWIEGESLGAFRPTGSGQGYSAYRRRFLTHKLLVHNDSERLHAERRAMHTGRAEAWQHGNLRAGPYVEYDIHAAYATIGRDCEVPAISRGEYKQPTTARVERWMQRYAVLADVTVTTDVECVPFHVNGRTMWPVGTFRTWLWDPELQLALEHCKQVKVHTAYTYTRQPALRDFCTWVLDHLDGQTQVYGLVPQRVIKHWSRCLVGRLGLRYRIWHKFGEQDPPDVRLITYLDLEDGVRTDMMIAGRQRLLLGDMEESPESLPQIPGWVMSECRRRLWKVMQLARLSNVVYIDTDSVMVRGDGITHIRSIGNALGIGHLAHKGTHNRLTIHGPRNIEASGERRISGLPLTATQTAPLEFTGEVMRSVKRSMRNGELDMVVSLPRQFHITPQDLRRQHNTNGSTSPFRLEQHD